MKKIGPYKFYNFNEVFGRALKSEKNRKVFNEEVVRLKMARQIRAMRLARKFTQKILAEKAKMPQSVIARLESGEHSFSLGTLHRVARVFGKEIMLG